LSIFIEKDGKKVIPVSIYLKLSLFLALILLSTILLRPIQNALSEEMLRLRTNLIQNLEDFTGMKVRYSSLRPSFLGSIEIKNLKLFKDDTQFFTVSGIKIHFSIIEFIFKKKTFIHTVQIDYPSLSVDANKDKALLDSFKELMDDRKSESEKVTLQKITEFLPRQANYQIRHLNVNYKERFREYKIENMNLNLRENNGEIELFGRFLAQAKIDNVSDRTVIVSLDAGINGAYSSKEEEGNAQMSVFYLTGSQQEQIRRNISFLRPQTQQRNAQKLLFSMAPFSMGVTYKNWIVEFNQTDRLTDSSVMVKYNMETGGFNAGVSLEKFKPGNLIYVSDIIQNADSILQLQITGDASLESENGRMKYSADIKGDNVIVINAYGNENEIFINDIHVTSPVKSDKPFFFHGSAGAKGYMSYYPLASEGKIFFSNFSLAHNDSINASFDISTNKGEIFVLGENISIAQVMIDEFTLFLYPLDKNMGATISGLFNGGGALYLDAVYNNSPSELEAALSVDSLSLYNIMELFRPFSVFPDLSPLSRISMKNSSLNADIFFSTDFKNIVYNAPNIDLNYGKTQALISLSGTDHQINLTEGRFIRDEDALLVSSKINFANPMELIFSLNANYNDLSWNIDGQILDRKTLIVRDPNGLHVYGNVSNTGAMSGYIEGLDYPVSFNSNITYLNFFAALRFDSRDFWNLNIERFSMREANSNDGRDYLNITGFADQNGASFKNFLYQDSVGRLHGDADLTWEKDFSNLDFAVSITDGQPSGEYYYANGKVQGEKIHVQGSVSDMHVNRFIKQSRPIILSGDLEAAWDSINSFNAIVNLKSLNMRHRENPVKAAVKLNFSNDELLISNLSMDYAGVNASIGELHLNRADGILNADARLRGNVIDKKLAGNIGINANFSPIESWLALKDAARKFEGSVNAKNFEYGDIKDDNFFIVFAGNDGSLSLKAGRNDMIRIELDPQGNIFAGFSAPVPIRGTVVGTLKNWNLDAHCNDFFIDISTLYQLVSKKDAFNITSGYITGKTDFIGPVWNPEFHGYARASSMRFRAPDYITEDIRTVPFDVTAQGYEMSFGPVATVCGAGGGNVSGWFLFENWSPKTVGLDIKIPRDTPVPYGINVTGFLANGTASGTLLLNVDGINSQIELKGDLFTNESQLGLSVDDIKSNQSNDTYKETVFKTIADFKITTGSMVEFNWPAASPILRVNPEMGSVIQVTTDTGAEQYSLISDVKIRSGELYYFDRNFYIRQGGMVFRENETRFDPKISARAEIRDRTDTGPVIISMIIENQPLFRFEPRFEASPTLTQLEIYSILGQNFNSYQGEGGVELAQRFLINSTTDLVTQFMASSDVLSQLVFVRRIEKFARDTFKLDMFSLRTRLLQNMVVTGVTELGGLSASNVTDPLNPSNFIDNTTVFMGKYIGKYMFAQAMFTLKKDETSDIGIRVEPDIGIELQSPFLTIRWDFFPNYPTKWATWAGDNSITLSWSKSF